MPSIKGKPKEQISYKCPHDLMQKINDLIADGDYASRNDIITAALREFFTESDMHIKKQVKDWLTSGEGETWIQEQIRRVVKEEKSKIAMPKTWSSGSFAAQKPGTPQGK
jgi:Arc/MetJ-type ribon-helix-helix transcriptional regulator